MQNVMLPKSEEVHSEFRMLLSVFIGRNVSVRRGAEYPSELLFAFSLAWPPPFSHSPPVYSLRQFVVPALSPQFHTELIRVAFFSTCRA